MASVFVVGVAVIDFVFQVGDMPGGPRKYRADDAVVVGGGCAANAAVAIARHGGDVSLAARLGDDPVGDLIAGDLAAEGVDTVLPCHGASVSVDDSLRQRRSGVSAFAQADNDE